VFISILIFKLKVNYKKNIKLISLDGNIGAGKSTLLNNLQEYINKNNIKNIIIIKEPVDIWESTGILKKFYEDKKKYAGMFQLFVLETLIEKLKNAIDNIHDNNNYYIITERSLESTRWVFAQMLYNDGNISEEEMNSYTYVYNMPINSKYLPDSIIYLNTPPDICNQRIIKRGRPGENIEISYLEKCNLYYKKMINNAINKKNKVLEINNNQLNKEIISFIIN